MAGRDDTGILPPIHRVHHILAIAIDTYEHAPRLYNCVRDSEQLIETLITYYDYLPQHVYKLYNAAATEENILLAFKELIQSIQPEDTLLIVYSGHGEYETDIDEGYWLPVDARLERPGDYISNSKIIKYIKAIPAHHTFLLVDSCFSGSLFATRAVEQRQASLRLDEIASRWLLTAGRNEVVSDGQPGDHSPFMDNVIYFLRQNRQDYYSVHDLVDQVIDAVIANARQIPRGEPLQNVGHRGGQFHFYRKGVAAPVSTTITKPVEASPPSVAHRPVSGWRKYGYIGMGVCAVFLLAGWLLWPRSTPVKDSTTTELSSSTDMTSLSQTDKDLSTDKKPEETSSESVGNQSYTADQQADMLLKHAKTAMLKKDYKSVITLSKRVLAIRARDQQARKFINLAQLELDWSHTMAADTEAAYRGFIKNYPKSTHTATAQKRIADRYRYTFDFSYSLNRNNELTLSFPTGDPPYKVRITFSTHNRHIERQLSSSADVTLPLETYRDPNAYTIATVVIYDGNFKGKGYKVALYGGR